MFQIHYLNKISQQGTALWTEDFALTDDVEKADAQRRMDHPESTEETEE